jgi:hypothetical protein
MLVFIMALSAGGAALASGGFAPAETIPAVSSTPQPDQPRPPAALRRFIRARLLLPRQLGQVKTVQAGQFTMQTVQGNERTITAGDKTGYRALGGEPLNFSDLKAGQWVSVMTRRGNAPDAPALLVTIMSENFDPQDWQGPKARGSVTAVDPAAQTFSLKTLKGWEITCTVEAATRYLGKASSLNDLKVGLAVEVAGEEKDDKMVVKALFAHDPIRTAAGIIKQVDTAAGTVTLQALSGEEIRITVNDSTRFRSPQDTIQNLADLKPDMRILVIARQLPDGSRQALSIFARPQTK